MPIPPRRTGMRPLQSDYDHQLEDFRTQQDPAVRLRSAAIPEEHAEQDWNGYSALAAKTTDKEIPKHLLRLYADWLSAQIACGGKIEGLTLLGPPGVGKSLGAALVAKQVCLDGGWVKWIPFDTLVERDRALVGLSRRADSGDQDAILAYNREQMLLDFARYEVDLLVLDDVGQEYRTESRFGDALLHRLTRRRSAAGKATLITSNLLLDEWTMYSASMASFLFEVGDVLTLVGSGDNQRAERKRGWRDATR